MQLVRGRPRSQVFADLATLLLRKERGEDVAAEITEVELQARCAGRGVALREGLCAADY